MHEQRAGQIADVGVGGIDVALAKREELLLDRERLGDQFHAGEGRAAGVRVSVKAMPQAEELSLQGERVVTEAFGLESGLNFSFKEAPIAPSGH